MTVYENEWQFLRSSSQEIVNLAKLYDLETKEWRQRCEKFQRDHHVELVISDTVTGDIYAVGVSESKGTGDLPGQWCKPQKGVIRPYGSNQLMRKYFEPLSLTRPELPGIDKITVVDIPHSDGFFCGTSYFIENGVVWAKAGASAAYDSKIWTPVQELAYRQAKERRKAVRKVKHV